MLVKKDNFQVRNMFPCSCGLEYQSICGNKIPAKAQQDVKIKR